MRGRNRSPALARSEFHRIDRSRHGGQQVERLATDVVTQMVAAAQSDQRRDLTIADQAVMIHPIAIGDVSIEVHER
jgi:hypothetical protein